MAKAQNERQELEKNFTEWITDRALFIIENPRVRIDAIAENAPKHGGTVEVALKVLKEARDARR